MGLRFQGVGAATSVCWASACAILMGASSFAQTEGFEGPVFPPAGWTNAGTAIWSRHAVSAYGVGTNSVLANFYSVSSGTGLLETATFEAPAAGATLGFDYAYAAYAASYVDRLAIQISTNAGATYAPLLAMEGGATGALNTAGTQSSSFVPTAAQWRTKNVALPANADRLRFDAITAYGNNLFLDNVQIYDGTAAADVTLALAASPNPARTGSNLTYLVVVSNAGPVAAEGVVLTNRWPSGAILVSAEASRGTWTTNGETIVADLGSLAVGATAVATVVVQPAAAGIVTNVAGVAATTWDPQTGNNRATAATPVDPADLALTLTDSPDPVAVGSNLTYLVAVSNAGPGTAENVAVSNGWPAGLLFVSAEASQGTWATNAGIVSADFGALAAGATATLTLVGQAQSEGSLQSWAEVATTGFDPQSGNNRRTATTQVGLPGGDLVLSTNEFFGAENGGGVRVTVVRTNGLVGEVSCDYETLNGTAEAGIDYVESHGTLAFSSGVNRITWSIPLLDDDQIEDAEFFTVRLCNPQGGAFLVAPSNAAIRIHDEDGVAALPFAEGFETGTFSNFWGFYSTAVLGPQISTNDEPRGGLRHVNMNGDSESYSLNELVLSVDLAGKEGVHLRFWHKRLPYEWDEGMADAFTGHSYADGVAIGVDGTNWFKVHGLTEAETGTNEYRQFDVALDPILAARGLSFTERVRIKFQACGYYYPPYYGRFFDDVELYTSAGELRFAAETWTADESAAAVTVAVERVQGDSGEVSVDYATTAGTASVGEDYESATGTLTFSNGVRCQTFVVPIVPDGDDEPLETFIVQLANPQGGATLVAPTQAVATIVDDDGPGELAFAAPQYAEQEDNGFAAIAVNRLFGRDGEVSVRWRTQAGTATPGADYAESTGTVTFADGSAQEIFEVQLLDDGFQEGPETVQVFLEEPEGGTALGLPTSAWLTIQDDEAPRAPFPFYEGFESGVWSNYWTVRTNGPGRIRLLNPTNGFEGNRSLAMDSAGGAALNEATLTVDLSGQTSAIFRCWTRDFADAAHPMPETFLDATNADGIAVSADGLTWHRLVDLAALGNRPVFTNLVVDLAAFAAEKALPLTSTFQIRFQQYGDGAFPAAGRSFDHVSVAPAPPATSTVIRAQGFEGGTGDDWAFALAPATGQIAVRNERKAGGARSLRLTGSNLQNADPCVEFENVLIGSINHVCLSVAFSASGVDTSDDLYLDLSYDNGATWNGAGSVKLVDGYSNAEIPFGGTHASNPTTVTNNPWTVEIPAGRTQLKVRVRFDERSGYNNSSDLYFVDDVELYYLPTNQPPALDPVGDWTALVSNRLEFAVVARDIDSNVVALVASNLPAGATFEPRSGTAPITNVFGFTPDETQADAVYPVVFHASDMDGYNAQTATIRVLDRVVTFSANRLFVDEESGVATLGVSLSRAADAAVPLALGGLAVLDEDYVLSSTSLAFAVDGPREQTIEIAPIDDALSEGPENVRISVASHSEATAGDDGCEVFIRDDDSLTLATANLTSGGSAIYMDAGARILQALVADVVAIQEFNVTNAAGHRAFVDLNFGTNFFYCVEPTGNLPNGVVSRWPILAWGEWEDPQVGDRDFVWATVDVPGGRPLHVVSVHLHASGGAASREIEARLLTNYVAQAGYHPADLVALCGDLNTQNRSEAAFQILRTLLSDDRKPTDQNGDTDTNQPRDKPYDVVLPVPYLDARHLPVHFGGLTFAEGLAFDTRLWTEAAIPYPARVSDSGTLSMQHMGVEKVFALDRFVTLLARSGGNGAASPEQSEVGVGSNQAVALAAAPYFHVGGVAINGAGVWAPTGRLAEAVWTWSNAQANAWLDATFAENLTPAHGVPEWWLAAHGVTNGFAEAEGDDLDEDGFFTWQEYVMDSHPRDGESFLRVDSMEFARDGEGAAVGYVMGWPASTGRVYDVEYLADLAGGVWLPMDGRTNLAPDAGHVAVTNVFHDGRLRMLRLQVRRP
ncbi:MAG: Calx-beta domain-containing protein [Kiritimatiellia bacterium]